MGKGLVYIFVGVALFLQTGLYAQHRHPVLKQLDSLISVDGFDAAQHIIGEVISGETTYPFLNEGRLVYPLAKSEFLLDPETEFPKAQELLKMIRSNHEGDSIAYEALLGLGLAHIDQGSAVQAKAYITQANRLADGLEDAQRMVASEFHLSEVGLKLGDMNQLMKRTNRALQLMGEHPGTQFPLAPRILNYKGSLMYFTAKPDSADYYFEKAIQSIDTLNTDPEQRYYLPGTIYGNWTMVKQSENDLEKAMALTLKSIASFNAFLEGTHNHPLTEKVRFNLSISYRNLGSLYNDFGDKEKAIQVATLGYHHSKKHFLPNTVQYFSAVLMMGEAHLYGEDLQKARKYLQEAEASLQEIPGDNWAYAANLYYTIADLDKRTGDLLSAIAHYERTLEAYGNSNSEEFSQNSIYARANLAQSLAENGQFGKAQDLLEETYAKVLASYGQRSHLSKMLQLTKVRMFFLKGDFEQAIQLCEGLLEARGDQDLQNRPYLWGERTEILLYLAKSKLGLGSHSQNQLEAVAKILDRAISLVEKRKSLVTSQEGVANLIESSREAFDLGKKVYLKLYDQTGDKAHLEKVMALHESSIYNRIRARLNLRGDDMIPKEVREREGRLREEINTFFDVEDDETQFNVAIWDSLSRGWQDHMRFLQKEYPKYYGMRYASIVEPLRDLGRQVPPNTTLVRYFSDGDDRYAYVYHRGEAELVALGQSDAACISTISDYGAVGEELFDCLYELYQRLWRPLEGVVRTEQVIIFPDGELFNLAFELLTPKRIQSYAELATGSLLAEHILSYNYSLFMLGENKKVVGYKDDFIAFAPEFDQEMKTRYQMSISDSLFLDKTYLTLLPQPFSTALVKKFSRRFDGSSFLNERASKPLFIQNANEHKIIHIGTHAESNNVSPELSRLVFAKNVSNPSDINDNYLYTYEIYNQDLGSNLAILTACETGKPTYQPGEGMISLAHAFNYAGSESVLTSLWQIDEESSSQLLESFYRHLMEGRRKDEALRLAKLEYLAHAEGRTLHPQYWAGLVLMGDTSPIHFTQGKLWPFGILAGSLLLILLVFFLVKKKSSPKGADPNKS
ncbi:CHAT domain-containing protein [Muricauda oceani]|jgi:tetratricopeptide (TPR) repeat protein|uniref:CHAT domain-containing protein n=2 Tax=Flagellimonas TaxID=444459 RepID=A0A6G7IYF4_9FLAO|nr:MULTISPECIES: CHAT domain-containing protein [Allomuricauda]MBW8244925.1 CHAT domain-containing protein [Allomuricauda oceani]MDF0708813.1 CHAT domain-containing protein [[Muricauda] okinawensis]QII43585.1 CHAT domain-containing protein [Allomuricauda oceani]